MIRGTRILAQDEARLYVRTADTIRGFLHQAGV
jgi:hypothetical protein